MEGAHGVKDEVVFSEEIVCVCVCTHPFLSNRIFKWSISVLQKKRNTFYPVVNLWA